MLAGGHCVPFGLPCMPGFVPFLGFPCVGYPDHWCCGPAWGTPFITSEIHSRDRCSGWHVNTQDINRFVRTVLFYRLATMAEYELFSAHQPRRANLRKMMKIRENSPPFEIPNHYRSLIYSLVYHSYLVLYTTPIMRVDPMWPELIF